MIELWMFAVIAPAFAFWMCGHFLTGAGLFVIGLPGMVFPPAILLQWYFVLHALYEISLEGLAREQAANDELKNLMR